MPIDPALFRPEAVSPETRAFNKRLSELMAGEAGKEITPEYLRRRRREGSPWQAPQQRLEYSISTNSRPGMLFKSSRGGWLMRWAWARWQGS